MRKLNGKQKRMLDEWFKAVRAEGHILTLHFDLGTEPQFDAGLMIDLENEHDYETLYQDVNRYIYDKVSAEINKVST